MKLFPYIRQNRVSRKNATDTNNANPVIKDFMFGATAAFALSAVIIVSSGASASAIEKYELNATIEVTSDTTSNAELITIASSVINSTTGFTANLLKISNVDSTVQAITNFTANCNALYIIQSSVQSISGFTATAYTPVIIYDIESIIAAISNMYQFKNGYIEINAISAIALENNYTSIITTSVSK